MSNVAVLIDADNVSPRWIRAVLAEAATLGTLALKRVYGDFSRANHQEWRELCAEFAIQPIQQYPNTKGKNASDIAMVIDAMDLLHANRYSAFCLVSSDSDFSRLATRLRENGGHVWGFGEQKTPKAFVAACTRFVYVEVLTDEEEPRPVVEATSTTPKGKRGKNKPAAETKRDAPPAPAAQQRVLLPFDKPVKILLKAVVARSLDEDGWASMGEVGSLINKQQPAFDSRNYGFGKLSDMLRKSGLFELQSHRNGLMVRPKAGNGGVAPTPSAPTEPARSAPLTQADYEQQLRAAITRHKKVKWASLKAVRADLDAALARYDSSSFSPEAVYGGKWPAWVEMVGNNSIRIKESA
ncbi:NYN domain-containing protein [Chitinimonas sp. BJYL2]|uniref:NYN domain-containing protein n=1 Tax=Chitinimonas sp. BJYL2 TaxID=2976696 RepID=UPI0022B4CFFA|nr:NYN domain-containing protein [Chitinimonas sp. BJYL2]